MLMRFYPTYSYLHCSKRNALGIPTYRYLYSGNFTNVTPRYWLAGMHSCSCLPSFSDYLSHYPKAGLRSKFLT